DCNLAISYVTEKEVERIIREFTSTPAINKYLAKDPVWIGTFNKLSMAGNAFDSEQALANVREKFVKTTQYTYTTVIDGKEETKTEYVNTYIISLYFKTAGGDQETIDALDAIDAILQDENGYIQKHIDAQDGVGPKNLKDWYYIGGNAQNARNILKSSLGDMPKFVIVAVAVCLVILLLTTQSYLEPLIFLATLGISILLNMGTNIIAGNPIGKISSITSSCATILQLAIAMDYSIFLMHTYYEELKLHPQPKDALIAALPKTIAAISASMLTTVGGFLSLFFMEYGIGYDLGFVLAKGVILSLLSTVFLQPILILILSKGIKKTKHKWIFAPKLKFVSKGITHPAVAAIVVVLVLGLALPCAYFQLQVPLSYVATSVDNPNPNLPEQMASSINNQAIVLVPYEGPESLDKHIEFVEKVKKIGYEPELDANGNLQYQEDGSLKLKLSEDTANVIEVFSLSTILSKDDFESIEQSSLKNAIYSMLYDNFIANRTDSTKQAYMLYTITLNNTNSEGVVTNRIETQYSYNALKEIKYAAMETFENYDHNNANEPYLKAVEAQKNVANFIAQKNTNYQEYQLALEPINQFKDDLMNNSTSYQIYLTGLAQGSYELAEVTPNDFLLVTLLSAAIVLLILLFTFKNFKLSIILMLVIESGIWINLSLVYFTSLMNPGHTINFVAYLIVTAIELGATVDYAIMLTTKYLEEKKSGVKSVQSIKNAINRAAPGVTTSALILIGVCALVHLITTNMIVGQITRLLAIGTTMSYVFVFTLLPAILSFDERLKRAISIKRGKGDPDKGRLMYNPNYYNQDGTRLPEIVVADESAVVETASIEEAAQVEEMENDEMTADATVEAENTVTDEKPDEE
nr:MMPL family transporter [Clostridia bacterium]